MKSLLVIVSALLSAPAFADGFICENLEQNVRIKVYNQTQPELGTRNPAIMIVSDPSVSHGRKTIATFRSADSLLTAESSQYTASVDLRYSNSNRAGERLANTRLGEVDEIAVDVDFSYAQPVEHEAELSGLLTLNLRGGEVRTFDLMCERYLKN